MFKIIEFFTRNWKILTMMGIFIFMFAMIKPLANMFRGVKDGIREMTTPAGFFAFLILLALAIFLIFFFKGML
jgi:hypothetical protein